MDRFSNIFGAAAIAVNMTGAVEVQASPETTKVNGVDGRAQLHPLPDVIIPDFLAKPENILKSNGNILRRVQPYDSIGAVDERKAVTMGMREYNPVLQMMDSNGNSTCTATIVTVDGFESNTRNSFLSTSGTIITTAAHCLENRMPILIDPLTGAETGGEHIGFKNPEDVFFKGSYLNEFGHYKEFTMRADEVWVNPLYMENENADAEMRQDRSYSDSVLEADTALIFTRQFTPYEVIPARLLLTDYNFSLKLIDLINEAKEQGNTPVVTVAGHSADKPYLTNHENAKMTFGDYDGVNTGADIVPGASGGPVFVSGGEEQPVNLDENGQPIMFAVNSTVTGGTDYARHSYYNQDTLNTVPFLKPAGSLSNLFCSQSGEVIADNLNIRVAPDVDAQTLARGDGQTTSQLSSGALFTVHGEATNQLGQVWALVTTELGRTGYISANPDYVRIEPQNCLRL